MLHSILGICVSVVLNVSKSLVKPRPHPLTAKLDLLDLAKGGENLFKMFLIDIPGQPPDVNLGRLGGS